MTCINRFLIVLSLLMVATGLGMYAQNSVRLSESTGLPIMMLLPDGSFVDGSHHILIDKTGHLLVTPKQFMDILTKALKATQVVQESTGVNSPNITGSRGNVTITYGDKQK